MEVYGFANVSKSIRELIQAKKCESIILQIMNDSQIVFPSKYDHVESQAHGECDFIDRDSKEKYDVKLLFSNEQCQYLAKGDLCLQQWIESLIGEIYESSRAMCHQSEYDITDTSLYKEMYSRLKSIAEDEYAILFIPFPILLYDIGYVSVCGQFATDIITFTYNHIQLSNNPPKLKGTYVIYPILQDQKLVLRKLNSGKKEYLLNDYFQNYINFEMKLINENTD